MHCRTAAGLSLIVFLWTPFARAGWPASEEGSASLESLGVTLNRCGIEANLETIPQIAQQLRDMEPLSEPGLEANRHYLLGLADVLQSMLQNGSPDMRDPIGTQQRVLAATRHFAQCRTLNPDEGRAYAGGVLCNWFRFMLGPEDMMALVNETQELLNEARERAPDQCFVRLMALQMGISGPNAAQLFDSLERDVFVIIEDLRTKRDTSEQPPEFWDVFTYGMAARGFLFLPSPRADLAADLADEVLGWEPDFLMANDFLVPFGQSRQPMDPSEFANREWVSLADDPRGDGAMEGLPDATGLQYSPDAADLWIRIPLATPPPTRAFGLNLVLASEDPDNSTAWWGGNSGLRFHRLITAWVSLDPDDVYRGAVGIADHHDAFGGAMTMEADDNVGFAADPTSPAFIVRVPWSDLEEDHLRLIAAVGTNAMWNDNAPNGEAVEITRPLSGK